MGWIDDDQYGETINTKLNDENSRFWLQLSKLHEEISKIITLRKRKIYKQQLDLFYGNYNQVPPIIDLDYNSVKRKKEDSRKNSSKMQNRRQQQGEDYTQLIKKMKNSITVGNESTGFQATMPKNIEQAKEVIISINNELNYHQKQTVKYALQAGQYLILSRDLCLIEDKNFNEFLKECDVKWSKSYIYFLISFYNFSKHYPKISNVSLSIHFIKNNFKKIQLAVKSEREFWRSV